MIGNRTKPVALVETASRFVLCIHKKPDNTGLFCDQGGPVNRLRQQQLAMSLPLLLSGHRKPRQPNRRKPMGWIFSGINYRYVVCNRFTQRQREKAEDTHLLEDGVAPALRGGRGLKRQLLVGRVVAVG